MKSDYTPAEGPLIIAYAEGASYSSAGLSYEARMGAALRAIARIKEEAWDECAARARGDMEAELAAANPYREEN